MEILSGGGLKQFWKSRWMAGSKNRVFRRGGVDFFWNNPITAHIFTANHIKGLLVATPSLDQSNRSPGFLKFQLNKINHLTLKMASAQVIKMSVTNNSPSQDSMASHPDDHFQSKYVNPGFKPFSYNRNSYKDQLGGGIIALPHVPLAGGHFETQTMQTADCADRADCAD